MQALEVATDVAGACVSPVEHQAVGTVCCNQVADLPGNRHHHGVHAQGVERRAEPLELPGQQHRVGTIQLLGGKATSAISATDGLVSRLEFIEPPGAVSTPIVEG